MVIVEISPLSTGGQKPEVLLERHLAKEPFKGTNFTNCLCVKSCCDSLREGQLLHRRWTRPAGDINCAAGNGQIDTKRNCIEKVKKLLFLHSSRRKWKNSATISTRNFLFFKPWNLIRVDFSFWAPAKSARLLLPTNSAHESLWGKG